MAKLTKLTHATSKQESLRTTVPRSIVEQFELKSGDSLEWKMEVKDGELIIIVRPVKSLSSKLESKR
jgi:bifunctional DNA-binding transcriptional regulator/antitoxin component of YhaV-PrlF toxin-antitoxin module